ncbi:MAG: hypothetical protein B6242_14375 [Anaerolineaceae bacterium 4572_78]|nr:MAG: hypothetical protein B6242_14375 [Anaerolineaceae bacterium 4572_78]
MGQKAFSKDTLFYGDNLQVLHEYVADESVDLIYLDPPFNSNRNYNVLYKDESGNESEAQITAFKDTWHWSRQTTEPEFLSIRQQGDDIAELLTALVNVMGRNQMTAYLVMMTTRLQELHRVLKPTGSLYLHCDPTASHYLKIVLDGIFGAVNFGNHITWQRSDTHSDAKKQFSAVSDHILFYYKNAKHIFNVQYINYPEKTLRDWYLHLEFSDGTTRRMKNHERETQKIPKNTRRFNMSDMTSPNPRPNLMYNYKGYPHPKKGWRYSRERMEDLDRQGRLLFPSKPTGRIMLKRYLDEQKGVVLGDIWSDISQLRATMKERLGYPTQKPIALLERIVMASSNEGDVILDPFCGCGTAVHAAQKLNRTWLGIDITHLATTIVKKRLFDAFSIKGGNQYDIVGEPTTMQGAEHLALQNRYQFQWWALGLLPAKPHGSKGTSKRGKKGADKGIDGIMTFPEGKKEKRVIVQVKSGKVSSRDIRDLNGTVDREKDAVMGVFITLKKPTKAMLNEAMEIGYYESSVWGKPYPKIQIFTIEEMLAWQQDYVMQERLDQKTIVNMPASDTLKKTEREQKKQGEQPSLLGNS